MATIKDFDNYLIYPDGKVYNQKYDRFLKPQLNKDGYYYVYLSKTNKTYVKCIHRLVAGAFIPNPNGKPEVDHIDRNRKNNNIENLRWATHSENQQNTSVRCDNKLGIKNICYCNRYNIYEYKKVINGNLHRKYLKTLEEAIAYKEEYLST